LHRLCPIFWFDLADMTIIKLKIFWETKHTHCERKAVDREEQDKKAYICRALWMPSLFVSGALWEEVQHAAKVVDGYSGIAGAHRHVAACSSWSSSLFSMCWWSWRCLCDLEKA
jgi:hypothetical protein